ncbi:MAG: twin-arginine translocase TatA/TatE family subunit, partial [Chloroflexi bacterium]|nr:twin-arginine translocase TatA/TatE family subunit [Chloroflexota bacterium]
MFDVGWPELLVILAVALLVFGPQRMVELARTAGKALNEFRKITNEFSGSFTDILQEPAAAMRARPSVPNIQAATPAGEPTEESAEAEPAPPAPPVFDRPLTIPSPIATPPDDYDPADQSMPPFPDEPAPADASPLPLNPTPRVDPCP